MSKEKNTSKVTAKNRVKKVVTPDAAEAKVIPAVPTVDPTPAATEEKPQLGRPVNPESARQKRLAEIAEKRAKGEIKRGRPVVEGSAHQEKLKAQAERKAANGGVARRGRPVDPTSPRQMRLAEMEAKRAAGQEIKRGRPAVEKPAATADDVEINKD